MSDGYKSAKAASKLCQLLRKSLEALGKKENEMCLLSQACLRTHKGKRCSALHHATSTQVDTTCPNVSFMMTAGHRVPIRMQGAAHSGQELCVTSKPFFFDECIGPGRLRC